MHERRRSWRNDDHVPPVSKTAEGRAVKLVTFAKHLRNADIRTLISEARRLDLNGYDWPLRPGCIVNPDNVGTALA